MKEKNTNEKKIKVNKFILFFRIISIIIIIYCLFYILTWFLENKKSSDMLKKVTESSVLNTVTIQIPDSTESSNNPEENPGNQNKPNNSTTNTTKKIITYSLDFNNLLSINTDTVGWISVPNTSIHYPVVKHSDNKFYLNHSFDKSYNKAGWIFADYRNKFDGTDKNIIVYGHNRVDNSMFATLANTQKKYWYSNPSNKYITFNNPNGQIYVYEIFSAYTIKSETYYLTTTFKDDNDYQNFLNTMKNRSIYNFGVNVTAKDKILTLSTCDSSGKSRIIVHAKRIV